MSSKDHPQIPSTEAMYDDIGAAYEPAFAGLAPQIASVEWLKTQLKARKPAKFLDIGCGTGKPVCYELTNEGHDVLGIDLSTAMITAAERNCPNATFQKVSIAHYHAPEHSFDAISVYFSLLAGVTQAEIRLYIERIFEWLKPGGLFVYATIPGYNDQVEVKWMGRTCIVSGLPEDDVVDHLTKTGFEISFTETTKFTPKGVEAGLCKTEDIWEETHLFVYSKKN